MRVQFLYDSTNFTNQSINNPIIISRLRWRFETGVRAFASSFATSATVRLSTAPIDQSVISTTFANNQGQDLTVCYSAPVSWPAAPATTGPCPFLIDVPFATPFFYDPNAGDLNIEVEMPWPVFTGHGAFVDADNLPTTLASFARLLTGPNGGQNSTASLILHNYGVVVEVTYVPATLSASFLATPTTGGSPLLVQFTDQSYSSDAGGITSWAWDFDGDSIIDSTLQNPSFTYNNCGSYDVSLTVTDASHTPSTLTRRHLIVTDNLTPSFSYRNVAGNTFQFTDTSTPTPTSWAWDFDGDNIVDSTLQNPAWTYPTACTIPNVSLTVNRHCRGPFTVSHQLMLPPRTFTTLVTGGIAISPTALHEFDIQVTNPSGVVVCGVTMCPYLDLTQAGNHIGSPLACTIWVTDAPGGFAANQANTAVWRQVATGTGAYAGGPTNIPGAPVPVPMSLSNSFYLATGTYGMAIYLTGSGVMFSNLSIPATYAGPDFNITSGFLSGGPPFFASGGMLCFWQGRIHYSTHADNEAGYGFFGAGCAGTLGIPGNRASTLPRLGQTMTASLSGLNMNAAFFMMGFSRTSSLFGPLPLSLTPFGAPGCFGRVSTDSVNLIVGTNNIASIILAVPNNPIYLGMQMYTQGLSLDTPVNTLGAVTSDAAALIVGQ